VTLDGELVGVLASRSFAVRLTPDASKDIVVALTTARSEWGVV
jgi:hypothetical protein